MKKIKLIILLMLIISFSSCSKEGVLEDEQFQTITKNIELAYPNIAGVSSDLGNGISLEKINNEYILSGDIILTKDQVEKISNNNSDFQAKTGLSNLATRWTNCKVYYTISPSLPNQNRVHNAIAHWEAKYNIDFILRTNQNSYIDFVPSTGCSSFLGKIGGRQEIRLASGCSTGNTIHEIGHALGFLHEQQRTDRGNSIVINWGNIQSGKENNFRTYSQLGISGYQIGEFDFNSIMLYGSFAFSNNGNPTITRLNGNTFLGQRNELSVGDLEMIADMYGCNPPAPAWVGPPLAYTRYPDPTICINVFVQQFDEYKLPISPGAETYTLKSNSPFLWVNGENSSGGASTVQPNITIDLTSNRVGNYTVTLTTSNQFGSKTATIYVNATNCSGTIGGGGF